MKKGGKLEAEVQVHEKAAREVGKDLTLGMEAAGRLKNPKNTKTLSKDEQLKALSELLSSTDDKGLNDEQKTLKKGMLDKGFKDVIDKTGKIDDVKLMKLFKETEATIAKKNALDPNGGKEGKNQVTAVFEKGQKFEITGTLGLESKVLAGMVGPSNTSSA